MLGLGIAGRMDMQSAQLTEDMEAAEIGTALTLVQKG
jgi:hypothetical protein